MRYGKLNTGLKDEVLYMPYMKYGDWYVPGCEIKFPTECEAMEYMADHTGDSGQMLSSDLF